MSSCAWFPLPYGEIVAWVEQHRDMLPTTLAELSTFPVAFRRVIVNHVDVDRRTLWWQDHLRSFLAPEAGLTPAQRAFIAEAVLELPSIFGCESIESMRVRMRLLEERAVTLLTREQGAAIFAMIGPAEPPGGLPIRPGTRLTPIE